MYILGILVWVAVVVFVARLATVRVKDPILRAMLVVFAVPLSFVLALADEIVGKFQFDRLCEEAKEVKIHGTISVGEELYTADGKWRLDMTTADASRLGAIVDALIRWEHGGSPPQLISAAIDIYQFDTRIYERKTDRLLADWRIYTTQGGWLGRQLGGPLLVSQRCDPPNAKGWGGVQRVLQPKTLREEMK